jgi:hypothetical protein
LAKREIRYLPVDEIQPDPRNPRAHDSIEDVKASILRFGFVDPIIHDGRTGRIVAGHGRREALTELRDQWRESANGKRKVPDGIQVKGDQWLAPVVFGLETADDDEAAGLLVNLNRLTETGGWLPDKQLALLGQIADSVKGLEGIGFTDEDVAALREMVEAQATPPDEFPEYDENIDTEHTCPKCGYAWSGGA